MVRRIPELNKKNIEQPGLFDLHRFHAVFTIADPDLLDTVAADKTHRQHAIIEQVNADLKNSALAHMPSGKFTANAAWLVCAVMAFNLTRTAGVVAAGGAGQGYDSDDPASDHRGGGPGGASVPATGAASAGGLEVASPVAETVRSRSLAAGGCFFLTTCAGFLRPELNYHFVERPDDDVIWGSPLPEILGGARSRNQPITEGPSADPG